MTSTGSPYLILVGVDYSKTSDQALEYALGLASANSNAELHAVHVVPAFEPPPLDDSASALVLDLEDALERLRTYVATSHRGLGTGRTSAMRRVRVVSHLRVHAPAHSIAQLASDLQADLVVVGMHGRGAISHFFLGSVAEAVARLAPCPVLVFRPKGVPPEYPRIEPPCPRCVDARFASGGQEFWCGQHRDHHGLWHVYQQAEQ